MTLTLSHLPNVLYFIHDFLQHAHNQRKKESKKCGLYTRYVSVYKNRICMFFLSVSDVSVLFHMLCFTGLTEQQNVRVCMCRFMICS